MVSKYPEPSRTISPPLITESRFIQDSEPWRIGASTSTFWKLIVHAQKTTAKQKQTRWGGPKNMRFSLLSLKFEPKWYGQRRPGNTGFKNITTQLVGTKEREVDRCRSSLVGPCIPCSLTDSIAFKDACAPAAWCECACVLRVHILHGNLLPICTL